MQEKENWKWPKQRIIFFCATAPKSQLFLFAKLLTKRLAYNFLSKNGKPQLLSHNSDKTQYISIKALHLCK